MYQIMIADDEKTIRESLAQAVDFESCGFQVCAMAKNGADALEKYRVFHPDVILLDVCMPILDGLEFLSCLQKEENNMPYITILSGYSDFEYARSAMRFGVKAYLTKPLDEDELLSLLLQLKQELDNGIQKRDNESITNVTKALQKIYHEGKENTEEYKKYFLMHCVLLWREDCENIYSFVREELEKRIPNGKAALLRNRGSVLTYLVKEEILEEYQYSVTLFGRHILHHIKKHDADCAILFDTAIFRDMTSSFRNIYDIHLYKMMTDVFWRGERIICIGEKTETEESDMRIAHEDSHLDKIKYAVQATDRDCLREEFDSILSEARAKKLNIVYIQEISYRIYYILVDIIQGCCTEDKREKIDLKPLDWRDECGFICAENWEQMLWKQINLVTDYVVAAKKVKNNDLVEKILSYIQEHFREPISLKNVADNFYISSSYLGKCMMNTTGEGFKQYVNRLRMEEAKRLLRQTDEVIYKIAEEVGFGESKYFVSKFTAEMHQTPTEYRKLFRNEKAPQEQ